jgi:hypothetical protein
MGLVPSVTAGRHWFVPPPRVHQKQIVDFTPDRPHTALKRQAAWGARKG